MGEDRSRTFREVAVEFIEHQALYNMDRRGHMSNARVVGKFFDSMPFTEIQPRDIQNMIAARRLAGVKPSTINRSRAFLSVLFNWAIDERGIHPGPNPVSRIRRFKEPRTEPRILMPEEAQALLHAADQDMRFPILLALYTGARRGELRKLKPSDIDFNRCLIRFRRETTKSKRERLVPFSPKFRDMLLAQGVTDPGREFVIDRAARQFGGLRRGFQEARTAAGLPWVTWVTLRHTFAGWFLTNGGGLTALQEILGHANPMTTMIYKHFIPGRGPSLVGFFGPPRKASSGIKEGE